jgi:hypothetical protein
MQLVSVRGWLIFAAFGGFAIFRFVIHVRLQRYIQGLARPLTEAAISNEQGRRFFRWDRWCDRLAWPAWLLMLVLMFLFPCGLIPRRLRRFCRELEFVIV